MSSVDSAAINRAAAAPAATESAMPRPAFRWSEIGAAPLHDYPIRDEILLQFFPYRQHMDVLEVGPGSGYTAYRLADAFRSMTLLDVAEAPIAELRQALAAVPNLRFACADACAPDFSQRAGGAFDALFALDMFEYVPNPAACLRNMAAALRPNGVLFLSFPNVPPPVGDGATWFTELGEIESLLREAGFVRWEIFAVRYRKYAAAAYTVLHEWPLRLYRRLRRRDGAERPQTYEATWAFRHREQMLRRKRTIHAWWAMVTTMLRLGGNVFKSEPLTGRLLGRQLVIRAWR